MKKIELQPVAHKIKVGYDCPDIEPNITADSLFLHNGVPIGFYMHKMPPEMCRMADIANQELRSSRVPKALMARSSAVLARRDPEHKKGVEQYSTIIGSVPPKAHMRRPYPTMSSVHQKKSAQTFIKAMLMLCQQSELLIKKVMPEQYEAQKAIVEAKVPPEWRFGNLFTSSISNYNIASSYHRDTANLANTVNVIITKRHGSIGGNTTVPDYNATTDNCDNSILVYPAWRNIHGVTPIKPTMQGGYRNTLVFYPLKAFEKYWA